MSIIAQVEGSGTFVVSLTSSNNARLPSASALPLVPASAKKSMISTSPAGIVPGASPETEKDLNVPFSTPPLPV
jgi:hypothetical protein